MCRLVRLGRWRRRWIAYYGKRTTLASKLQRRSFANDILVAASARELGAVILTENSEDFTFIASVLDIQFQPECIDW